MPEVVTRGAPQAAVEPTPAPAPEQVAQAPQVTEADKREQAFAKREKWLRDMQKKNNEERESWSREKDSILKRIADMESGYIPKSKLLENPYQTLTEAGVSYDKVTEQALQALNTQDPVAQHISKLEAKIAELEGKQTTFEKTAQDQATQQYQAALKQIEADTKAMVDASKDFELVRSMDAVPAVVKLIEAEFQRTGQILDVETAAREVEDYLFDEAMKVTALEKVKAKLAPAPTPQTPAKTQRSPMQTLTNSVSSTPRGMTPAEKRARAIAAFKGELA